MTRQDALFKILQDCSQDVGCIVFLYGLIEEDICFQAHVGCRQYSLIFGYSTNALRSEKPPTVSCHMALSIGSSEYSSQLLQGKKESFLFQSLKAEFYITKHNHRSYIPSPLLCNVT